MFMKELIAGLAGLAGGVVVGYVVAGVKPAPLYPDLASRVRIEAFYPVQQWQPYALKHVTRIKTSLTESDVWMFCHNIDPWTGDPEAYMNIFWNADFNCYTIEITRCGALAQKIFLDGLEKALWEGITLPDGVGQSQQGLIIFNVQR